MSKDKISKCFTYRGEHCGVRDSNKIDSEPFYDLKEYRNPEQFLREYFMMDPAPFESGSVSVSSTSLKSKDLCPKCPFSSANGVLSMDLRLCTHEKDFLPIWSISLNQTQKRTVAVDGTYPSKTTITPLTMKDIRLNGRPCQLVINRVRYKGHDYSIPLECVSRVQPEKKRTLTIRLICAINEYLLLHGAKHTYLAEGYGISRSSVKNILNDSASRIKQKQAEIQDDSLLSKTPEEYTRELTVSYTSYIRGTPLWGVCDFSSNRLINLSNKNSLQRSLKKIKEHLWSSESVLSIDPELVNEICELTRIRLSAGKDTGGLPAELVHLTILLWTEVLSGLAQLQYRYSNEKIFQIKAYLNALLRPILQKIFLNENAENIPTAADFQYVCTKAWDMNIFQTISTFFEKVCDSLWKFAQRYKKLEEHYKYPLRKWNQIVGSKPSLEEEAQAKEILNLICTKATQNPTLSANEVIFHILYFNEAIIEPSLGPNPFSYTPTGDIIATLDQVGIPFHCLKHLLNSGLLSENPNDRPTCSLYRSEHFDPDSGPCTECPRQH